MASAAEPPITSTHVLETNHNESRLPGTACAAQCQGFVSLKLGDFSSLKLGSDPSSRLDKGHPNTPTQSPSTSDPLLGNFSRIFDTFGKSNRLQSDVARAKPKADASGVQGATINGATGNTRRTIEMTTCDNTASSTCMPKPCLVDQEETSDSALEAFSDDEILYFYDTPATSTSGSPSQDKVKLSALEKSLCYQPHRNGPLSYASIEGAAATQLPYSVGADSLERRWNIWKVDEDLKRDSAKVYENGLHVFLDASNIHIGFLQTLKNRLKLPSMARFTPNPTFNMAALTDFMVRERPVKSLTAGCSVLPNRADPPFINQLRHLDYRVDVRERKKTHEPKHVGRGDGPRPLGYTAEPRYVEDYVDETLQTRIGETVMQCFGKEGTLVLATGDAKPAPYSDGFFAYADRALTMGWHVEVICWNMGCSSTWKDPKWTSRWGGRFRLIELDVLLDDLWLKD